MSYRTVPYFNRLGGKERFEFPDFERRLIALETLAAGRVQVKPQAQVVHLRQAPDLIQHQIEKAIYGSSTQICRRRGTSNVRSHATVRRLKQHACVSLWRCPPPWAASHPLSSAVWDHRMTAPHLR